MTLLEPLPSVLTSLDNQLHAGTDHGGICLEAVFEREIAGIGHSTDFIQESAKVELELPE